MNALALLLVVASSWLYTTNSDTAVKFGKALDEACGYPNPSTFTYRAVMVETNVSKTATNYTVICPDAIYAPKVRTYLPTVSVLPKERQTEPLVDDFANVDAALGNAKTNAVPAPKEGMLAAQDFVLVTDAVIVKVKADATNAVKSIGNLARKAATLAAASATASWDPNPESDIAGYRVYYHASDTNAVQTVSTTNTQTRVDGLVLGKLYLFQVSALNTAQFESRRSETVSYYVSTIGPGVPSTNALPSPVLTQIKP